MPLSRKRKKKGKAVKNSPTRRAERLENMESSVTLQELINVLAYQEYVKDGTIDPETTGVDHITDSNFGIEKNDG